MVTYPVEIVADSLNVRTGQRLTTFRCTFPRFILAEVNTHRMLSRNTASSRAIPTRKLLELVRTQPVIPVFGENQAGMQAGAALTGDALQEAQEHWRAAAEQACVAAEHLLALNVHKQAVNRLLEPFLWVTSLLTATDWGNWFGLRSHPDAQPEIQRLADTMLLAYTTHTPTPVEEAGWHLPLVSLDEPWVAESPVAWRAHVSAARCARVSYSRLDAPGSVAEALQLADRLAAAGHWSPFEHQAMACATPDASGNFRGGWRQYRHTFAGECRTPDLVSLRRQRLGEMAHLR